jgi:hypothetical protein
MTMSLTPDAILALLALIIMLAPAARYIYRFVRRHRHRPDEEAVSKSTLSLAHQNTFQHPLQWPRHHVNTEVLECQY